MVSANDTMEMDKDGSDPRTELDAHANVCVVGQHCHIVRWMGRNAEVNPFAPDYEALPSVPIVDAALLCECPHTGKEHLLIIRNALCVKSMTNNLIPPFVMREAGIKVDDIPKMQVKDPSATDHAIVFPDGNFCMPLSLWGIFSYFPTKAPSEPQM